MREPGAGPGQLTLSSHMAGGTTALCTTKANPAQEKLSRDRDLPHIASQQQEHVPDCKGSLMPLHRTAL